MRTMRWKTTTSILLPLWVLGILLSGCTDAPRVTDVPGTSGSFALAPSFALTEAEAGNTALQAAFDRVNAFRVVLSRIPGGELALDQTVTVQPGQSVYDLSFQVELWSDDETFSAVITALDDEVVLFTSPPITVRPSLPGEPASAAVNIPLTYSGPGATATAISVAPAGVALSPGGNQGFSVVVTDASGNILPDVPLAWSVDGTSVLSVDQGGTVQALEDGKARVTATTPTGLSASAWVYVVSGEIAYVRDGKLYLGPISTQGGSPLTPDAEAAASPAWSLDGSALYYEDGGKIWKVGESAPLGDGSNPSVHPDGSKLVADHQGGVVFMNADGSNPTDGPPGSNAQWDTDGEHLILAGGSLQRVRADDTDRRTLDYASGAQLPFLCPCGERVAYLQGGSVYSITSVGGGKTRLLAGDGEGLTALSRPAMSQDGSWVLAAAEEAGVAALYLVPADGNGPALQIAGSEGATDPAWKPQGTLMEPLTVEVTGYEPAEPAPGDEVVISGSGFDWIIPDNNQVLFPAPAFTSPSEDGEQPGVPGEILGASPDAVRTRVPDAVGVGQISVGTNSGGQGNTRFTPAPGTVVVTATKPPQSGVQGVQLTLSRDGEQVETATTDATGQARFPRIETGIYQLSAIPPEGFVLAGNGSGSTAEAGYASVENPQEVRVPVGQNVNVPVPLDPLLHTVRLTPQSATVEVGGSTWFSAQLLDIVGDPFPNPPPIGWSAGTDHISAVGYGQRGMVTGLYPTQTRGEASLLFTVLDQMRTVPITVTSFVTGSVTDPGGAGLPGMQVNARQNGQFLGSATTGSNGQYRFAGLPGGTVDMEVLVGAGQIPEPSMRSVALDKDHPTGTANFVVRAPYPGRIVGNVYDGITGAPVEGAQVTIAPAGASVRLAGDAMASLLVTTTDASGGFDSGDVAEGLYRITVDANGYQRATATAQAVSGETTVMAPIGLIGAGGPGTLQGRVRDATTSAGIPGATVELREGAGAPPTAPVFATTQADGSGFFSFPSLPAGNYTLRATAPGFAAGQANAALPPETTLSRDVLLSPQLAEGEVRIVLTWGTNLPNVPSDLDSHTTGPIPGGGRFHVAYYNRGSLTSSPFVYLHNDDVSWEGPETTTITQQFPGVYRFSVHLYCCGSTVRYSQAQVQVFDHTGLVATFSVPNQDGRVWNVFDMENGVITPLNTMDGPFDPPEPALGAPVDFRTFVESMPRKGGG